MKRYAGAFARVSLLPANGPEVKHIPARLTGQARNLKRRKDVAAGATAGDDETHVFPPLDLFPEPG